MIQFGNLNPDGSLSNVRNIEQSAIMKCPHLILVAEHYRADGSCRCDDPRARMAEWGYVWDATAGRWVNGPEEAE